MSASNIPVFLFTGFLDSGKTTFVQSILEDKRFNDGRSILLIVCEEGEEEYDFSSYPYDKVTKVVFDDESKITYDRLNAAAKRAKAEKIVVEYNGLWNLDTLFQAFPEDWGVAQEMTFADATTYPMYNKNMRNLVFDKIKTCDAISFNRMNESIDKMELHKIVRSSGSRGTNIMYDWGNDKVEMDDIVDPLPFDVEAPVIEIGDQDYALWYQDMMDDMKKYNGKHVRFKAFLGNDSSLPKNSFLAGRHVMACCADDVQFAGLLCYWMKSNTVSTGNWAVVEGKISVERTKVYQGPGPVIYVEKFDFCDEPEEKIVSFT